MDEIGGKGRTQGVTNIPGAWDMFSGFSEEGVIHGYHQRSMEWGMLQDFLTCYIQKCLAVDPALGKETIRGRPIVELKAGGHEEGGKGAPSPADQTAQGQAVREPVDSFLAAKTVRLSPQRLKMRQQKIRSFLKREGVETRRKIKWPSSWIPHSIFSPLAKWSCWASAAGTGT